MKEQKEDLFCTYDVSEAGYCVNFKGKPCRAILAAIKSRIDPALMDCLDYFSASDGHYDVDCRRVIVYTVRGASEGYYTHLDMVSNDGQLKNMALAKTLDCQPDRMKDFERALWEIVERGS